MRNEGGRGFKRRGAEGEKWRKGGGEVEMKDSVMPIHGQPLDFAIDGLSSGEGQNRVPMIGTFCETGFQ